MPCDGWVHLSQVCTFAHPADGLRPVLAVGLGVGSRLLSRSVTMGHLGGSEFFSTSQRCKTLKGLRMKAP